MLYCRLWIPRELQQVVAGTVLNSSWTTRQRSSWMCHNSFSSLHPTSSTILIIQNTEPLESVTRFSSHVFFQWMELWNVSSPWDSKRYCWTENFISIRAVNKFESTGKPPLTAIFLWWPPLHDGHFFQSQLAGCPYIHLNLSITATSPLGPLSPVLEVAIAERFNCRRQTGWIRWPCYCGRHVIVEAMLFQKVVPLISGVLTQMLLI